MKRTALVTGAGGAIGNVLVNALHSSGYYVRALVRNQPSDKCFPGEIDVFRGDINDPLILAEALEGVDVVFHLAAKLHINDPAPSLETEYEHVNVNGTKQIVDASVRSGVQRIVFFSTISVYGAQLKQEVASETSSPDPVSAYARSKLKAEGLVLNAVREKRPEEPIGVVLRLGAVYGPHMKGNYLKMVSAIRKGLFLPIGRGDNFRTMIFEKDAVTAAILAAESPNAAGRIFNVTDGNIHTLDDILHIIYAALNRRKPAVYIPIPPVRFMAGIFDRMSQPFSRSRSRFAPMIDKLAENVAVSGDKIRKELGFDPVYDLQNGWQETVDNLNK